MLLAGLHAASASISMPGQSEFYMLHQHPYASQTL